MGKCKKTVSKTALAVIVFIIFSSLFLPVSVEAKSSVSAGNYYFNNSSTGHFLGRTSNDDSASVTSMNGILSSIGSKIAWTVTMKDDTYCTLRRNSSSGAYLCCSSSGAVSYTKKSAPDDSCLWNILMSDKGITIRNKATNMYLYQSGVNIKASSVLYAASYWRTVLTSNYNASSDSYYRELTGLSAPNITVKYAEKRQISISKTPTSGRILWAASTDFSYASKATEIASVNSSGAITGISPGQTTITVTHKPTGKTADFTVTVWSDSALLGTKNDGHDHYSSLQTAKNNMSTYAGLTSNYYSYSETHAKSKISRMLQYSRLFVSRTHGYYEAASGENAVEINSLNNSFFYASDLYDFSKSKAMVSLKYKSNIVTFVGCKTAAGSKSIAYAANKAGANASIGFTESIECSYANQWTCSYVYNIANYKTVADSCYNALHDGKYLLYKSAKLDSYKIFGNGSMSL
ncbi:MAG: Ig-like domain-containing protein [Butyrivibrio sp.]|nr:Ig-like domain-containing protein [Butyrivibrio sp.]